MIAISQNHFAMTIRNIRIADMVMDADAKPWTACSYADGNKEAKHWPSESFSLFGLTFDHLSR